MGASFAAKRVSGSCDRHVLANGMSCAPEAPKPWKKITSDFSGIEILSLDERRALDVIMTERPVTLAATTGDDHVAVISHQMGGRRQVVEVEDDFNLTVSLLTDCSSLKAGTRQGSTF
jgi:hypothetical protein